MLVVAVELTDEVRQESPWILMFAVDIDLYGEQVKNILLGEEVVAKERREMKVSCMCVNQRGASGMGRQEAVWIKYNVQSEIVKRREVRQS